MTISLRKRRFDRRRVNGSNRFATTVVYMRWRAVFAIGCSSLSTTEVRAESYDLGGTVHGLYASRMRKVDCASTPSCGLPLAEERLQLKLSGASEATVNSSFLATVDLVADHVTREARFEPREIYADISTGSVTIRAGRQLLTWGIGDYVFVNDVFPKNWESFFLGRPPEYLKEPSTALRAIFPYFDFVLVPVFQADVLPTAQRFSYSDGLPANIQRDFDTPRPAFDNLEAAVRISAALSRWDLSWYGSRGFYRSPALSAASASTSVPSTLSFIYPRLNTVGFSIQGPLLDGLIGFEAAYYDSVDNRKGTNPLIDNSEFRALGSYSQPLWTDASLGIQLLFQGMVNYDNYVSSHPKGSAGIDRLRWTATARFTQLLFRQLLQFNLFAFAGITDEDAYVIPSLRYAVTDALTVEAAGNIFLGEGETTFGRFRRNTNLMLGMHYGF